MIGSHVVKGTHATNHTDKSHRDRISDNYTVKNSVLIIILTLSIFFRLRVTNLGNPQRHSVTKVVKA